AHLSVRDVDFTGNLEKPNAVEVEQLAKATFRKSDFHGVLITINFAFVQSEEHRPNSKCYSSSNDDYEVKIPFIDLDKSSPQEVEHASKNWGFFHVINHGLPYHVLRRLESAAADFFSLLMEEKRKISRDAQTPLGYFDMELTKNVRDWKEVFDFMPRGTIQMPTSMDPNDLETETFTNQWPSRNPDFRYESVEHRVV
ncbi:hypothetical protein KI387_003716, partial [Taxus chinensis]